MRKIRNLIITIIIMSIVSILCLLGVSAFSYTYKWKADKALMGITLTYILTGFAGGVVQKIINKEPMKMGRKMIEGILISSFFMGILLGVSVIVFQQPYQITSRFLMIWMLLVGSTCLGRIL